MLQQSRDLIFKNENYNGILKPMEEIKESFSDIDGIDLLASRKLDKDSDSSSSAKSDNQLSKSKSISKQSRSRQAIKSLLQDS